ncbi:MAG: tetratricopeptide repeat protein [Promethearchaeota archaeon]
MPDSIPEDLTKARQLMYQAKFLDALEILDSHEKRMKESSKNHLLGLILRGKIYFYREQYKKATEVGDRAYQLSQKLGCIFESVDALLIRALVLYFGKFEVAVNNVLKAEQIFQSLTSYPNADFTRQQADIFLLKSIVSHRKGDLNEAMELAKHCMSLSEKLGEKLDIARIYYHLGELHLYKNESDTGLEYAKKALVLQEELSNKIGIAKCRYLVGESYYTKGDIDQALKLIRKNLTIKEISSSTKLNSLDLLGGIYISKGELDRALRYRTRVVKLAKKEDFNELVIMSIYGIGVIYRIKGESDLATNHFKRSLELSEKFRSPYGIQASLFYLILTALDTNSLEQAKRYLNQLEYFAKRNESQVFNNVYIVSKALVFKKSGRIRNRTEAEILLKQIIESEYSTPPLYLLSLVNLCELFLEELFMTNNPEVLNDLDPLIVKMVKFTEKQQAYLWLAETRLLQAKLALIQMKIEEAKQILTQAQRIAELHGLNLLAIKISAEHDNLLEGIKVWDNLKKSNAPMSDRIKLVSFNGPIERLQGKRAIEFPEPKPEVPVLLLIIGEAGFPLFSNQFKEKLIIEEDLISAFLSAFNSFSSEIFSKGLDRAKFGEYMILMQTINSFSICYLFKGQTYTARQKLSKFTDLIRSTTSIWQTLNNFYRTSRIVELKDLPPLDSLITEIFIS